MSRRIWTAVLAAVGAVALPVAASAQDFKPTRPLELVVHGGPGSGNDVFGRELITIIDQEKLSPVRVTISNRPGGGSTTAAAYMASKAGDSNTIAVFTNVWLTDPLVQEEAKVSLHSTLTPIARMVIEPALVGVRADSPYKTLKEFVDAAKAKPGALKQSGGSITARENIIRQLIMKQTGANWSFISFPSGGERLSALLGGHVDLMILDPQEASEQVRSGKIRIVAQVAEKRLEAFKDIPTIPEAGFMIPSIPQVRGIVGVPNMPPAAVAYYEDLIGRVVKTAQWKKFIVDNYFEDAFMKGADAKAFLSSYENDLREQMRATGAKIVR
jgi:putative tricarboxylic transport membrane protein